MRSFALAVVLSAVLVAAQSTCTFPTVPPNFQTDFSHRVASSSGNGQIVGHIYSDDLNNRTRFDYTMPGSSVNYTVIEFINVQAKTETEYILTKTSTNTQCMKHTFPWVQEVDNCTAWNYLGQKSINGNKVLAFICNCTFGVQSYALEWFWQGPFPCSATATYQPYEVIIQGPGYYSETDYKSFQLGTGGSNQYYVTPTTCSGNKRAPTDELNGPAHVSVRSHLSYLLNHF